MQVVLCNGCKTVELVKTGHTHQRISALTQHFSGHFPVVPGLPSWSLDFLPASFLKQDLCGNWHRENSVLMFSFIALLVI